MFLAFGIGLGSSDWRQPHNHEDNESVRLISARDIKEKLDGKDAKVTFVEVTLGPGQSGLPHRHPGRGSCTCWKVNTSLGLMISRQRCSKRARHFTSRPGVCTGCRRILLPKGTTRLIAVVLHPREAKEIAIPEKPKE